MSQRALALATRTSLRQQFNWDYAICDLAADGRPPADAGELFVGVSDTAIRDTAIETADQYFGVAIVVTQRITYAPEDKQAEDALFRAKDGAHVLAQKIHAFLHLGNTGYAVMALANQYVLQEAVDAGATASTRVYGFSEPLKGAGISKPQFRGPNWWRGTSGRGDAGYSVTVTLDKARRLQPIAGQY